MSFRGRAATVGIFHFVLKTIMEIATSLSALAMTVYLLCKIKNFCPQYRNYRK